MKRSQLFYKNASDKLKKANEELFRPQEDIVSYSVCKNSQFAIESYLKGYLLDNNQDISTLNTIDKLYEQCVLINTKFKKIDLSDLNCKAHKIDTRYCDSIEKVSNCFDAADSLDTLLRQEKII
ncbi:MAG TPA: HEPN domain-containing protein [Crocinitomix sp.]|nr:HEPN domain-containing protein [Crocinitomix sp.]